MRCPARLARPLAWLFLSVAFGPAARAQGPDTTRYPVLVADLAIVAGRPAERITDLRKTERVVRGGKLYAAVDLYLAAGLAPSVAP